MIKLHIALCGVLLLGFSSGSIAAEPPSLIFAPEEDVPIDPWVQRRGILGDRCRRSPLPHDESINPDNPGCDPQPVSTSDSVDRQSSSSESEYKGPGLPIELRR